MGGKYPSWVDGGGASISFTVGVNQCMCYGVQTQPPSCSQKPARCGFRGGGVGGCGVGVGGRRSGR